MASLYIGVSILIQSLIYSLDFCSVIQFQLNHNNKPEDTWSYKRFLTLEANISLTIGQYNHNNEKKHCCECFVKTSAEA